MKKLFILILSVIMISTYVYADNGIVSKSDWTISAAQFTKQLISSLGYINNKNEDLFYINKAKELDIIQDGEIDDYNNCISRGQVARMVVRSLKEKYPKNIHSYINQIHDYSYTELEFQEYILKAYVKGIITGYDDKMIKAEQNTTFSESSTIIERLLDKTKRLHPPSPDEDTRKVLYKAAAPNILTPVESVPSSARPNEVFTVSAQYSEPLEKIAECRHQMSIGDTNNWVDVSTKQSFNQQIDNEGLVYYRVIIKDTEGNWSENWSAPVVIRINSKKTKDITSDITMPDVVYEGVPFNINTNDSSVKEEYEWVPLTQAISAKSSFNLSAPYKGNLTAEGGTIYFEESGYHTISFKIETEDKSDIDDKIINVVSTPYIVNDIEGERKENRILTCDFTKDVFHKDYPINLNKSYIKVINLMTGKEAKFNKYIVNTDIVKGKSFIDNKIEFIINKSGMYKVIKYVEDTRGESCLKETIIQIIQDKPPIAELNISSRYYRDSTGSLSFEIEKEGYSPDNDNLQSNFIYYKIDSDNDGDFNDEWNMSLSGSLSEQSKVFYHNSVGKIQFTYIVRENFDTLLEYVTADDFLCTTFQKVIDIQNKTPHTKLEFCNNYEVNINVIGSMTNDIHTQIKKLINEINKDKNININLILSNDIDIATKSNNLDFLLVMGNDNRINDYKDTLYKNNIKVIWLDDLTNSNLAHQITNDTNGFCVDYSNTDSAFRSVKNYLLNEIPYFDSSSFLYKVKGEPIKYVTHYSDLENDPMKTTAQRWRYTLDVSKPYNDGIPPWNNTWLDYKLDKIEYNGEYIVEFQAKDCPIKDERFENYNKWSTVEESRLIVKDDSLLTIDLSINPEYPTPVSPGKTLSISAVTFSTSMPEKVEAWIDKSKKITLRKTKIMGNKAIWTGSLTLSNSFKGDYIIYTKAYMGNKTALDQDLVKVFVNRAPNISMATLNPSKIYEGEDANLSITINDEDIEVLDLNVKAYLNGILIIDDSKNIKPPYKLIDYNLLDDARPGYYTVELSVTDQSGKKDTDTINFSVDNLSIFGSVKHTEKWNENRIEYNMQKTNTSNTPRAYNVFWSGEKFLLYALTTNITGDTDLKAEKVSVKILNEGYSTDMYPSNSTNWYGSIFEEDMLNRWGIKSPEKLTFRFTVYYSNEIVRHNDVEITIDNTEKQWKVRKIN